MYIEVYQIAGEKYLHFPVIIRIWKRYHDGVNFTATVRGLLYFLYNFIILILRYMIGGYCKVSAIKCAKAEELQWITQVQDGCPTHPAILWPIRRTLMNKLTWKCTWGSGIWTHYPWHFWPLCMSQYFSLGLSEMHARALWLQGTDTCTRRLITTCLVSPFPIWQRYFLVRIHVFN